MNISRRAQHFALEGHISQLSVSGEAVADVSYECLSSTDYVQKPIYRTPALDEASFVIQTSKSPHLARCMACRMIRLTVLPCSPRSLQVDLEAVLEKQVRYKVA